MSSKGSAGASAPALQWSLIMAEYKRVPVKAIEHDEDGNLVINTSPDAANDDWLRARRLQKAAEQGDEQARRELEELQRTGMFKREG